MEALRVDRLAKSYPVRRGIAESILHPFRRESLRALHNVSFSLSRGEILALLGPNGSGKTTLLKILASLVLPSEGRAEIDGMDVARRSLETRLRIGFCVSEERSFYYRLTGRQNLDFFGRLLGVPSGRRAAEIEDAAALLRIEEIDARFMTYSTGTRQKLCVARSLLGDRPVLLLDEPTRGLDPYTSSRFLERLRSLALKGGKAVLLASHDLEAVHRVADRLVFLHRGELLAEGRPEDVLGRFRPPREVEIELRDPEEGWAAWIGGLPGVLEVVSDDDLAVRGRCRIRVSEETFVLEDLVRALRERFGSLRRLEVRQGSLEDLYRRFAETER
ncbi:MAG: ABC transporter ATP-binding protein [Candidatus Eisenbacteria bacterium]